MRPLELLGWIAFMAVGSKCDIISPEAAERMCRQSEARYNGPPMPKIGNATFSGRGCPSPESRLAYNYMGKWRCGGDKYDAKFVMPGVDLRAGGGDMRKAECAITFHVEGLAEGWQVAVSSGELEGNWDVSSGGMPWFVGTSSWDGGPQQVGTDLSSPYSPGRRTRATVSFGNSLGHYSSCARTNGDVGTLTLKYNLFFGSGRSGSNGMETEDDDIDDVVVLYLKWLIRECH